MIQLRFVSVLILICLLLSNSPIVYAQSVTVTNSDWKTLTDEYQNLKSLWVTQGEIIERLEMSLIEALESPEILQTKIDILTSALMKALKHQKNLETHISNLEIQLTALGISLTDTLAELKANEGKHEQQIIDIITEYEIDQSRLKAQRNTLLVVAIIETILIGIGIYLSVK